MTSDTLFVTKTVKGNATVVIDKDDYIDKVELVLNNDTYYKKLNYDPSKQ